MEGFRGFVIEPHLLLSVLRGFGSGDYHLGEAHALLGMHLSQH